MLCDRCKKNQATYHFTQVVNGEKSESHLCPECVSAQASGLDHENLFSGLLGQTPPAQPLQCSRCGLEYARFQKTGLLGCSQCYDDFREQLSPMLQRIHGNVQHQGHVPASASEALKVRRRIEALQEEMRTAVSCEDFERAAQLRDMLREAKREYEATRQAPPEESPKQPAQDPESPPAPHGDEGEASKEEEA